MRSSNCRLLVWIPGDIWRVKWLFGLADRLHDFCRKKIIEQKERKKFLYESSDLIAAYLARNETGEGKCGEFEGT